MTAELADAECLARPRGLVRDVADPADVELLVLRCQLVDEDLTVILDGSAPRGVQRG